MENNGPPAPASSSQEQPTTTRPSKDDDNNNNTTSNLSSTTHTRLNTESSWGRGSRATELTRTTQTERKNTGEKLEGEHGEQTASSLRRKVSKLFKRKKADRAKVAAMV